MKLSTKILLGILLFVIGGILGWFIRVRYAQTLPIKLVQVREFGQPQSNDLINPILYVINPRKAPNLEPVNKLIRDYTNSSTVKDLADSVSVYFRDLTNSDWTGVNEDDTYRPSSMLKVMVMMTLYKRADYDPSILEKRLYYEYKPDPGQNFTPEHPLSTGYHSIEELIENMIIYSDNTASAILTAESQPDFVNLFKILQIPYPEDSKVIDFMPPSAFSAVFRTLYNAGYFSRSLSEKALELLTRTSFNKGLVAKIPAGIKVAHKFGEDTEKNAKGGILFKELHDCGIFYYPDHPYLLCVMTKGKDFNKLATVISTISKMVYDKIDTWGN